MSSNAKMIRYILRGTEYNALILGTIQWVNSQNTRTASVRRVREYMPPDSILQNEKQNSLPS